jgi:hypothetical protein
MLMVSTSASASACDLSCWLGQAHSDCHAGGAATSSATTMPMSSIMPMDMSSNENPQTPTSHAAGATAAKGSMSMPADMDMGPDQTDSSIAVDTRMSVTPGHLMTMSPRPEMLTERFMRGPNPGMESNNVPGHSGHLSSCTHETCSQISASVSPPRVNHAQANFLYCVSIRIASPVNPWTDSQWIRPGPPPPEILSAETLSTILRI